MNLLLTSFPVSGSNFILFHAKPVEGEGEKEKKKNPEKSNCIFQFDCLNCVQLSAVREVCLC